MQAKVIIPWIFVIALIVLSLWLFRSNKDFDAKMQEQERIIDSLAVEEEILRWKNDSLSSLEPEIRWRIVETEKKLKQQQDETDEIPGNVATYPDSKLDSILTNHRHKPRAKDTDSIND